ncbi:MAG: TorF family putative porin [Pseudomonadota bacterium]
MGATGQTARGIRKALRETLPVIRNARTVIVIAFTACGFSNASPAHADSVRVVTGSIGGTSDFVFRGLSLTRGKPAVQASLDIEFPKEFYVGAFIASADPRPGPSPDMEIDLWAGRYWRISEDFSADLRLSQYTYPDDPRRVSYNRTELTGTVGFRNQLFVAAIYSPNTNAVGSSAGYAEGNAWAIEVSARHPLNEHFSVSAGLGHYGLNEIYHDSYNYWNATLIASLKQFEFQLAYLGVDANAEDHFDADSVGDRVALTALWRFSSTN